MRIEKLIDDEPSLNELIEAVSRSPLAAIDTEFVRESTYYPKLCVLQVATDEIAACVDCLANLDLAPLFASLNRSDCTWVLHSGRQDLEVVWEHAKVRPARLIDTQIAAALTGCAAQIGLQEILSEKLGIDIGKGFTRTDWSRRPLPEGALSYALDDVVHLLPLWRRLERQLAELGRLEWLAEDDLRLLKEAEGAGLLPVFGRLKAVQGQSADVQAGALALVRWREKASQTLDRPRRWIMSDELLVRLAQQQPPNLTALAAVPDMPPRLAARSGEDILAALAGRTDPRIAEELKGAASAERPDREALKALQVHVKKRADELGVQPEILASRRDLIATLAGNSPDHLRSGWRAAQLSLPERSA